MNRSKEGVRQSLPPKLQANPSVRHTFRFETNSNVLNAGVSYKQLANCAGGVATSSTALSLVATSSRLVRIEIWPPGESSANATNVTWQQTAGQSKDQVEDNSLPTGMSVSGRYVFVPPSKTITADWGPTANTQNLFDVSCAEGSIIDITIDFTLSGSIQTLTSVSSTGMTAGYYYYPSLDVNGYIQSIMPAEIPLLPSIASPKDDAQGFYLVEPVSTPMGRVDNQSRGRPTTQVNPTISTKR